MSLTRLALKFAMPAVKLEAYRRYLFIGPHPDDIEIGAGATAARLAAGGKDVAFLICTDGRYGDGATALRGDELAEERKREAIAPVKVLAYYMTARPNTYVASGGYIRRQLDAVFSCHKTQFPDGSADAKAIALYLKIRAADFGLRSLKGKAEGFRALSSLQMHCMPEAGL